jgi:hypothetical protein
MPDLKWSGGEDRSWRAWAISLLTVLVAALLIVAIAEWSERPLSPDTVEESSH